MRSAEEIIDIIEQRKNKGHGLDCFKAYMKEIGDPHQKLSCIHIAGTNGKGSTLNFLRSILQEEGYKVGTFSSPYLETHRDRIRINDEFISERDFARLANQYFEGWMEYDLSMFEIDMALASVYFLEQNCDICIFEVGLGGRLDLTNILHPMISVITNIGMDHMEQLGNTYTLIAQEKAGIIKDNCPLVTSEEKQACLSVFEKQCRLHHSVMHQVDTPFNITYEPTKIVFSYRHLGNLTIHNGARYQLKNASCAIETLLQLQARGQIQLHEESIRKGIALAQWKGRFESVHQKPWIIVDGAHNEEGIKALAQSILPLGDVRILFAALKDKETKAMMEVLCSICKHLTVTSFPFYRAASATSLAGAFPVEIDEDFQHAILEAMKDESTPLIITGSLYFISQVRDFIKHMDEQ